jgi:uncharacterized protein (TIGR02117 family)
MNTVRNTFLLISRHRCSRAFKAVLLAMVLISLALSNAGCASAGKGLCPACSNGQGVTIYIISRGLHSGIIVREADIPPDVWPQRKELPPTEFLEVGWGDSEGYRYRRTTWVTFGAMFDSKGSVLLVHGFNGSIINEYAAVAREIIRVKVSRDGFVRLCKYIQNTYILDKQGRPIPLSSTDPEEKFYRAVDGYWLLNNCNNWTARALREAGCPISPHSCMLPRFVRHRTERFGCVLWRRGHPPPTERNN